MQELKDLYDIYDFWYVPWWKTWWGIAIASIIGCIVFCITSALIFYAIKKYRHKKYNEWQDINNQLGILLQKRSLAKGEYQQLIVLLKRKLARCFDHSVQSKTDEELYIWLSSFPSESIEYQLAPLFDTSIVRFAPASTDLYELASFIQMAFEYNKGKKVNP